MSRHLGREERNKKKEKKVRQLVVEVQGGLTILQGPGISGAAVTAPCHLLAVQALLVAHRRSLETEGLEGNGWTSRGQGSLSELQSGPRSPSGLGMPPGT